MDEQMVNYLNQIIEFYQNEHSKGFRNAFFKECGAEDMVLSRLHRAAINEPFGRSLHSRNAIWASNVCDLIDNAARAIKNKDDQEALRQLELAFRALMAYKDIQTVLDGQVYMVNDVIKAYARYLEHSKNTATILSKTEIVEKLRKISKVSGAGLPRDIDFTIKNGYLKVFIKNPVQNMQTDSAAFEGWILVLKSWLSGDIRYVELDFDIPKNLSGQFGDSQSCHYNRFLYRLNNMMRLFSEWFFVHHDKEQIVSDFMGWLDKSPCVLNHSLKKRESVIHTEKMERQIESWFAFEEGKKLLCKHWDIDENNLYNQLPIGVFYQEIAAKNAVFTRGASAVDLWGINKNGQELHLVELKCGHNKGIGVISETLFYIAVIYDTCISENNLFEFGKYGIAADTSDAIAIKNRGEKFQRLIGHILAESYHPLFSRNVEGLIAQGLSNLGIGFDRATYDYAKKVLY